MTILPHTRAYRDPHFTFHINTNDEAVFAFLDRYLAFRDTDLTCFPHTELFYYIHYRDRTHLPRAQRAAYHVTQPSPRTLRAQVHEKVSSVLLDVDALTVHADLFNFDTEIGVMDFTFLQPCRTALAHKDWFYVHAAHLHSATHDILITGPSGSGKSTLGYTLGNDPRFLHLSDDEVFISTTPKGNRCLPFPTKIGFKHEGLDAQFTSTHPHAPVYGNKRRFTLPVMPEHMTDVTPRPTLVLVPHYDPRAKELKLYPLAKHRVVREIADFTFPMLNFSGWPQQGRVLFLQLVMFMERAQPYTLVYNDALLAALPDTIDTWRP